MSLEHVPTAVLERYAAGEAGIGADALWAVEAHLEWCAPCRERPESTLRGYGSAFWGPCPQTPAAARQW